jgi:hypothetical protein
MPMLKHRIAEIGNGEYYRPITEEFIFLVLSLFFWDCGSTVVNSILLMWRIG